MDAKNEVVEIRKLSQLFSYTSIQFHESIGRKIGLSGTDHKYLGFFLQKGQMTAGDLASLTGLTTGAITGLIDRFETKKLLKRQPDKADRRKVILVPDIVKITELILPFYQDFQDETDELFSSFTSNERGILEKYFRKSIEIMDNKIQSNIKI